MIAATEAKAAAIEMALDAPYYDHEGISLLLAMITSANKEEREAAKEQIRQLTALGSQMKHQAEQEQINAAMVALAQNKFEP